MSSTSEATTITVTRDCEALLIPNAIPITIPAGSEVQLTQTLGGSYTVNVNGNLARIEAVDADALGLKATPQSSSLELDKKTITGPADVDLVWQQLRTCYDPEIPVNIVDLGLIYECNATDNQIDIKMTLTAPGCGMGPVIMRDAELKISTIPNVTKVNIELIFDPVWNQDMMSEAAKLELGFI
ncbi:MAG: putative Fe-S cluster assembly protein SufT [Legionellales bacterium]|nr:MAG: putative Fe-S cluster assembly protein SufT [Legionellales bacterium]